MDIFKRIRELKMVEMENDQLRREIHRVEDDLQEVLKIKETIPEDCVPGEYCKACEFAKEFEARYYVSGRSAFRCHDRYVTGLVCNKGNVCKNFIQKKFDAK